MKYNFEEFVNLLRKYVSYQSVSTDEAFKDEIRATVNFLTSFFNENGFKVEILQGPNTNPVIFAHYHQSDDMQTKLVYGHYDVQPANINDGWDAHPFMLREKDGKLIGRGVMDNKAQNLMHIFTVSKLISEGKLGCNVKFLIEGNEETSNPDMTDLLKKHKDLLTCDHLIVSDGEILGNTPTIEESLRGGGNITLTFKTLTQDVHSGVYGSAVPNPIVEMASFLLKMRDVNGYVNIPGFCHQVDLIDPQKQRSNQELSQQTNPIALSGAKKGIGKYDFFTATGLWPAIEISGITGGYTGEGYKNIIPSEATAKINVRLVASQSPQDFIDSFNTYLEKMVPDHVDYTVSFSKFSPAVKVDVNSDAIREIMMWQKEIYGVEPVIKNVGGGIPIVGDFKEILEVDAILLSLGGNDSNMHGPEENMRIELLEKGLQLSEKIFS